MLDAEIIPKWSPLDGVPPPEYVPPYWTGPHCGRRLVEGLRVLALMPAPKGPQAYGNSWPSYAWDWADLLAQQEAEAEQKDKVAREANRTRILPSSFEIARMETTIAWPMVYLRELPQLLRTVGVVAILRSRHRDLEQAARRLGLPGRLCRRWNREGLDTIARGLRADRAPVF